MEKKRHSPETGYPEGTEIIDGLTYEKFERRLNGLFEQFDLLHSLYDREASLEHQNSAPRRAALAPFHEASRMNPQELHAAIEKSLNSIIRTKEPYLKVMSDRERRTLTFLQNLLVELRKWTAIPKEFEHSVIAKEIVRRLEQIAAADELRGVTEEREERLRQSKDFGDQWSGKNWRGE